MTIMRLSTAFGTVLALGAPAAGQSIQFEKTLSNALRECPATSGATGARTGPAPCTSSRTARCWPTP